MNYSPALKWSVAVLLVLTFSWKLAVKPDNPIEIQESIVEFLANNDFTVSVTNRRMEDMPIEDMPIIEASSGSCLLHIAKISPLGSDADVVRRLGTTTDRTFFIFRGAVYGKQPDGLTVASYLWFRFFRQLGLVSRIPPIIAVVSSCDVEWLPWKQL